MKPFFNNFSFVEHPYNLIVYCTEPNESTDLFIIQDTSHMAFLFTFSVSSFKAFNGAQD